MSTAHLYEMSEGLTLEEQREWCNDQTILLSGAKALMMAFGGTEEGIHALKRSILEKRKANKRWEKP